MDTATFAKDIFNLTNAILHFSKQYGTYTVNEIVITVMSEVIIISDKKYQLIFDFTPHHVLVSFTLLSYRWTGKIDIYGFPLYETFQVYENPVEWLDSVRQALVKKSRENIRSLLTQIEKCETEIEKIQYVLDNIICTTK